MKPTRQGVLGALTRRLRGRGDSSASVEEAALLGCIARGDRQAFAVFYRRYHPRLYRFLAAYLRQSASIDEVINDTLFVVWNKAGEFRGDSQISTWVFGIAYRTALKALEAERRHASEPAELVAEHADPVSASEQLHLHRWVRLGLQQLSAEQRAVVELTYVFGYSYPEIAQIMQCPENTVKTRMFHARRQLQQILPALTRDALGADHESSETS